MGEIWLGPEVYNRRLSPSPLRLDPEASFRPMGHKGDRYFTFCFRCTTKLKEVKVSNISGSGIGGRDIQLQLKQNSVLHGHFIRLCPWVRSTISRHTGHLRHRLN